MLYKYEWDVLGRGLNRKLYLPLSHIEMFIPIIFGLIYLAFILVVYFC